MKKALTTVWIIVAVIGMANVDVCAEMRSWKNDRVDFSAVAEGDAGGENHYILQCGERCVRADTVAIGKPAGIATDAYGNVYFSGRSIVYKVDAGGYITRVAGNGTRGFSGDGGPARDALLDIPFDKYKEIVADLTRLRFSDRRSRCRCSRQSLHCRRVQQPRAQGRRIRNHHDDCRKR